MIVWRTLDSTLANLIAILEEFDGKTITGIVQTRAQPRVWRDQVQLCALQGT
jgi:hypothetical protein